MVTYEEQVEAIRALVLKALKKAGNVEPAALIHGLTGTLAQAIVIMRGPNVNSPEDALEPVQLLLKELVHEWWGGDEEILH